MLELLAILAVAVVPLSQWLLQRTAQRAFTSLLVHMQATERNGNGELGTIANAKLELLKMNTEAELARLREKADKWDAFQSRVNKRAFDPNGPDA